MIAPPVSAQKPRIGDSRVIFEPIVWTMRQPPDSVPSAIAAWQDEHDPQRDVEAAGHVTLRVEQHGDDAHGLLRVVAAVAERIERGRDELQRAEIVSTASGSSAETSKTRADQEQREREAEQRRNNDRRRRLEEA